MTEQKKTTTSSSFSSLLTIFGHGSIPPAAQVISDSSASEIELHDVKEHSKEAKYQATGTKITDELKFINFTETPLSEGDFTYAMNAYNKNRLGSQKMREAAVAIHSGKTPELAKNLLEQAEILFNQALQDSKKIPREDNSKQIHIITENLQTCRDFLAIFSKEIKEDSTPGVAPLATDKTAPEEVKIKQSDHVEQLVMGPEDAKKIASFKREFKRRSNLVASFSTCLSLTENHTCLMPILLRDMKKIRFTSLSRPAPLIILEKAWKHFKALILENKFTDAAHTLLDANEQLASYNNIILNDIDSVHIRSLMQLANGVLYWGTTDPELTIGFLTQSQQGWQDILMNQRLSDDQRNYLQDKLVLVSYLLTLKKIQSIEEILSISGSEENRQMHIAARYSTEVLMEAKHLGEPNELLARAHLARMRILKKGGKFGIIADKKLDGEDSLTFKDCIFYHASKGCTHTPTPHLLIQELKGSYDSLLDARRLKESLREKSASYLQKVKRYKATHPEDTQTIAHYYTILGNIAVAREVYHKSGYLKLVTNYYKKSLAHEPANSQIHSIVEARERKQQLAQDREEKENKHTSKFFKNPAEEKTLSNNELLLMAGLRSSEENVTSAEEKFSRTGNHFYNMLHHVEKFKLYFLKDEKEMQAATTQIKKIMIANILPSGECPTAFVGTFYLGHMALVTKRFNTQTKRFNLSLAAGADYLTIVKIFKEECRMFINQLLAIKFFFEDSLQQDASNPRNQVYKHQLSIVYFLIAHIEIVTGKPSDSYARKAEDFGHPEAAKLRRFNVSITQPGLRKVEDGEEPAFTEDEWHTPSPDPKF